MFQVFVCIVWNFELYMLPITLIIIFIKNLGVLYFLGERLSKDKFYDVWFVTFCFTISSSMLYVLLYVLRVCGVLLFYVLLIIRGAL